MSGSRWIVGVALSLALAGCPDPTTPAPAPAPGSDPSTPAPGPAPAPTPEPGSDPAPLPAPAPAPVLDPPFGEGVLLDWYESGGIAGRAHRVRVTAEEASLYFFGQESARSPLTDDERKALADLVASLGPIASHHSDGPDVRDGLSSGLFVAGTGAGRDEGAASSFAARLARRLSTQEAQPPKGPSVPPSSGTEAPAGSPKLEPPLGEGVQLDWYESGGIDGRAHRLRVTSDEAVLYVFGREHARSPLTDEERDALARLRATLAPIRTSTSSPPGMADGMDVALFVAGTGTGRDRGEVARFCARLEQRLSAH